MTFLEQDVLERVTDLDLKLAQRFPARDHNRALRLLSRQRRNSVSGSISASQEADRLVCLGGLEVKFTTGSSVQITPGQHLAYNASPVTETRPGTYSPAPVEADGDTFEVATLATTTTVAPSSPLGTAAGNEWWIVYVVPANEVVESDSNRQVYDETPSVEDFVAASSTDKVSRWTLTPGVARGGAGDTITTVAGTLPADAIMLAWVWVPSGATSLSNALFFDVRRLVDPNAPNMCGGRGRYGYDGTPDFTNRLIAPTSDDETFSGYFWARIKGQALQAVCPYGAGLSALKIKEPGATWDNTASPTTPKVAWLYLAAPAGYVPRLYAKGVSSIGNGGGTNELAVMHGALVLSSRAPKINVAASGASVKTSGLYDLRPSGSLHMPISYTVGGITYAFDGLTSDDAICLGPVIYTGYDTPNDAPVIAGPCEVSSDGWIGWPLGGSAMTFDYVCLFDTLSPAVSGGDTLTVTISPKAIAGGPVPITGAKITTSAVVTGRYLKFVEGKPRPFALGFVNTYGDDSGQDLSWATEVAFSPQQTTATAVGKGTGEPVATSIGTPASVVTAIRWPFNEPLAT